MKTELIEKLKKFPNMIEQAELDVIKLLHERDCLKDELEYQEADIMSGITKETDSKYKPKFSNDTARKTEHTIRVFEDKIYQEKFRKYRDMLNEIEQKKVMLNLLRNEFTSVKWIVKLITMEVN